MQLLKQDPVKAGQHLQKGFSFILPIITHAASWTLMPLLFRLAPVYGHYHSAWAGRAPEVARLLIHHIIQAADLHHGPAHPLTVIFAGLLSHFYPAPSSAAAASAFWCALRDLVARHAGIANMDYTAAHCWAEYALAKQLEPDPQRRLARLENAWTRHVHRLRALDDDNDDDDDDRRVQADLWMATVAGSMIAQGRLDDAARWWANAERAPGNRVQPAARWITQMRLMRAYRGAGREEDALIAAERLREIEVRPPLEADTDTFLIAIVCCFAP